ncbi:MAG: L-2-amino-thiazoline-4-carboxylic acid hydrolase, partial [Candidatus Heimdallarchaeaceae archaeon]
IMDIYEDLMRTTYDGMVNKLKESSAPFKTFVEMTTANPSPYENDFFQQETIQADEKGYHLDIHRCLFFEIFINNNLPELGSILCQYDLLMAKAIEPWARFERKETIASGSNRCTFRYYPC